jgi:3-deoxy-D-manno-octulosonic-acid transferase
MLHLHHIKKIEDHLKQLGFDATCYTEKEKLENSRVLIIDVVGILADLYYYSDLAYMLRILF